MTLFCALVIFYDFFPKSWINLFMFYACNVSLSRFDWIFDQGEGGGGGWIRNLMTELIC